MGPDSDLSGFQSPQSGIPECVAFVARHHWVMSGVIFCFVGGVYAFTHYAGIAEFARSSYVIGLALGVLYLVTGALVWRGVPGGRALSYLCSIFYLVRPPLGFRILKITDSAEFKAHFARKKEAENNNSEARKP